ncbi:MAG: hypothetical protein LH478_03320 [Chitinophagaceae bacterium]|nr:hypothetical protein [Chitinophagaceae bacterium]
MRNAIALVFLLLAVFGCKNKKVSLQGEDQVEFNDFLNAFPEGKLPFAVVDTNLTNLDDTTTISSAIFNRFIPDTIFMFPFGTDRKLKIQPVIRFSDKGKETYLVTQVSNKTKTAVYLVVLNNKNEFSAFLPLTSNSKDKGIVTTATIDKKMGVTLTDEWKANETDFYQRNTYAYNNVGLFTLVLNETNDFSIKPTKEVNPIDTFPKKNKLSGDYYKGTTNFISLRDGKDAQNYRFYIHFENDGEDKCGGELRGLLSMSSATNAIFKENNDPCVIDFVFTGRQVKFKEQGSCGNYRGIKCFFNDSYIKKRDVAEAKKKK